MQIMFIIDYALFIKVMSGAHFLHFKEPIEVHT